MVRLPEMVAIIANGCLWLF